MPRSHVLSPSRRWPVLLVSVAFLATPHVVFAQDAFSGKVTDPDGQPVAGASVEVRPLLDDALRQRVETDDEGRYRMESFNRSRAYRFEVGKEGFRPQRREIEAGLDGTSLSGVLELDFTLFPIGYAGGGEEKRSRLVVMNRGSRGVASYKKGIQALERGDLEKARARLETARDLDAELAPVYEALALVYHRQGEHALALEAADRALLFDSWDPDFLRIRFEALRALGRLEEARRTLDKLAQAAADPTTAGLLHNAGLDALRAGQPGLAAALLEIALDLVPDLLPAQDALAKIYLEQGKHESALAMSMRVLAQEPDNVEILRLRHQAWKALGDEEQTLAALDDLVRQDPSPRTATLIYNEGVVAFNAEQNATARALFERALAIDPDHLESRLAMAELALRDKRLAEVLELTEAILEDHPENTHAQRLAQRARARMGS